VRSSKGKTRLDRDQHIGPRSNPNGPKTMTAALEEGQRHLALTRYENAYMISWVRQAVEGR